MKLKARRQKEKGGFFAGLLGYHGDTDSYVGASVSIACLLEHANSIDNFAQGIITMPNFISTLNAG